MKPKTFLILILLPLLLSGCWDYKEYEKMAIVSSIGFDSGPGEDEITVTLAVTPVSTGQSPGGGVGGAGGGSAPTTPRENVYSAYARTVTAAIDKISEVIDNEPFFGYTRVIVLGNNLSPQALKKIILYLDMSPLFRSTVDLAVASQTAWEVVNSYDPEATEITSRKITSLMTVTKRSGVAFPVKLVEFYRKFFASGIEPAVPVVIAEKVPEPSDATDSPGPSGLESRGALGKLHPAHGHLKIYGMAVFKEYKMVGLLNGKESRGLGWVLGKQFASHITANALVPGKNHPVPILFRIKSFKTKIKVNLNPGGPEIDLNTKVQAYVEGVMEEGIVLNSKQIKYMQTGLAQAVKSDIQAAVAKAERKLNTDVLGFGRQLHIQHKNAWKDKYRDHWDKHFPNIPIRVRVRAIVLNTGKVVETLRERP